MTDYVLIPVRIAGTFLKHWLWRDRIAVADWLTRSGERTALRNLSDETLKDCGLSRADIEGEIHRLRW